MSPTATATMLSCVLEMERCDVVLRALETAGFFNTVVPEIAALDQDERLSASGRALHKDNLAHSFVVTAQCPIRLRVRLAALCHDLGKPPTRRIENGKVSFHNHETVGARIAKSMLSRIGFGEFGEDVATLVAVSGRLGGFDGEWSDSAVRRVATDAGLLLEDLLDLVAADCTSKRPATRARVAAQVRSFRERHAQIVYADARRAVRPALSGEEIMDVLDLEPGPQVGAAYQFLLAFELDGENLSKDEARARLVAWAT